MTLQALLSWAVRKKIRSDNPAHGLVHELRDHIQLLDDRIVEFAPALISGILPMPVGRSSKRVPSDEHRARPLRLIEAQQHIGEAEDRASRFVTIPQDVFWKRMIGAVREGVAVDDKQRAARM